MGNNKENNIIEKICLAKINIAQKTAFYHAFKEIDLISDEAVRKDEFKNLVHLVGEMWGVLRTVSSIELKDKTSDKEKEQVRKEIFSEFAEFLYNNIDNIKKGKFLIDSTCAKVEISKLKADPKSFISKICCLINPEHYKIIYDENNRKSLNAENSENWQETVEKYYEENNLSTALQSIFATDCSLWINGKFSD